MSIQKMTIALLGVLFSFTLNAQNTTQIVKGFIKDKDSEFPIIGATIILMNSDPMIGTITDENGAFIFENIPLGRQGFKVQYLGYKEEFISNILITTGKQVVLEILLEESTLTLSEVVVSAKKNNNQPLNEMATVSARSINTEEITRFSGGRNDISRLVGNFAGVSTADDSRNDIIVRGNSPVGLSWRMEGLPIPNPNHFSTLGTTGGPVSALNTNVLASSDFMTSAFSAEYGNATSGVFDLRLRNGNRDKFEFTAQIAAFSGLEFMAEGPINKKNTGSFILSYRYALTAIAPTGTAATPKYQDFTFKLDLPTSEKIGKFSIFGLGGLSKINFIGSEIDESDLFANPNEDAYVQSGLGIFGINHSKTIGDDAYIKTAVSFTSANSFYDEDNYDEGGEKFDVTHVKDITSTYNIHSFYNKKLSARFTFKVGLQGQIIHLNTNYRDRTKTPDWILLRDFNDVVGLIEPYFQSRIKLKDKLILNIGLHGQYFSLNNSWAIEPRLGLKYNVNAQHTLSVAYGKHAQTQPYPVYFIKELQADESYLATNRDLKFTNSHHFVFGYDYSFAADWKLKTEVYFQYITNVPVDSFASSFSILNAGADFIFPEKTSLVNEGFGKNYGVEITLEKSFNKGYYGLLSSSLYSSEYKGSDNIWRNSAFNNTYVVNFLAGKEFKVGSEKRNVFFMDIKLTTAGGRFYTPVNLEASQLAGEEVLLEDEAFSLRNIAYFKLDFKTGFRHNAKKKNFSQEFFVDFANLTNRKNVFIQRYNELTNEVNTVYQNGFFPDILYRIQF